MRARSQLLLLLTTSLGCTSSGPPEATVEKPEAKAEAKAKASAPEQLPPDEPAPPSEPTEKGPSPLTRLVEDLALLQNTEIACSSGQTTAAAAWANSEDLDVPCSLDLGDALHVVTPQTSAMWSVAAPSDHSQTAVPPSGTKPAPLALATKTVVPSPTARLQERWLSDSVTNGEPLQAWVTERLKRRYLVAGEVRGAFGDGIDRIVVLSPEPAPRPESEDSELDIPHEAALLVSGSTPRGFLPFGGLVDEESDGARGLQVAGVVDLDGDGTEEVLWASQPSIPQLVTQAQLSYYDDGEHRVHDVWSCSYCGCEALLPAKNCRGTVKFPRRSRR